MVPAIPRDGLKVEPSITVAGVNTAAADVITKLQILRDRPENRTRVNGGIPVSLCLLKRTGPL